MAFQQLQWPVAGAPTGGGLEHLQVRLQGQWQDNQWSCETLAIEAPGGRFELHDRAWMQADEDAWHGHVAFALDVEEKPANGSGFTDAFAPGSASSGSFAHHGPG
jgi:hypothetical protein